MYDIEFYLETQDTINGVVYGIPVWVLGVQNRDQVTIQISHSTKYDNVQ